MRSAIIPDGYAEEATLAANDLHDEIQFTYRPALAADWGELMDASKSQSEFVKCGLDLLPKQIKSWNIVEGDGKPFLITKENVAKLRPQVLIRMLDFVCGFDTAARTKLDTSLGN